MINNKKIYITALSVFSCIAVLCLHTSDFWNFSKTPNWIGANFVESFFYFAVPVFLMISGATLIDYRKRYSTKEYFKKRILKTLLPFIFWSIFALFFNLLIYGKDSISFYPLDIINSIFNTKYINIYYFFIILFSVYLSIPIYSLIPEEKRPKWFLYIIFLAFIINFLIPNICFLSDGKFNYNGDFSFFACAGYMVFPLVGYYIDNYLTSKKVMVGIFILGAIGFAFSFFGTWKLSWAAGKIIMKFKGYTSIFCFFYSISIFLLFKIIPFEKFPKWLVFSLESFGSVTFGVYLIHMFFIQLINDKLGGFPMNCLLRLLCAFGLFLVSSLLTKLLQKIPIVKKIVP